MARIRTPRKKLQSHWHDAKEKAKILKTINTAVKKHGPEHLGGLVRKQGISQPTYYRWMREA